MAATVDQRERAQRKIDQKDTGDDLGNGEAVVDRALIEVRAMRLPERLALGDAAGERDGRIGEIIEREDERRRQMALFRELEQQPAEQKTDRQASDVAQKEPRDRPVERGKAEDRAQQRRRDQRRQRSDRAEKAEQDDCAGHRHDLGHGHPVDAVHEIDEIDEPHAAEEEAGALDPPGQARQDLPFGRQRRDHAHRRQ